MINYKLLYEAIKLEKNKGLEIFFYYYGLPNLGLHHVAQSHFQRYSSSVDPDHTQHGDI